MVYRGVKFEALVENLDDPFDSVGIWVELPISKQEYNDVLEGLGLSDAPDRVLIGSVVDPFSVCGVNDLEVWKYDNVDDLNKVAIAAELLLKETEGVDLSEQFGVDDVSVAAELKSNGILDTFGEALMCVSRWPIQFAPDIRTAEDVGRYWETECCDQEPDENFDYEAAGEKLLAKNDGYFRLTDHGAIIGAVQVDLDRNDFEPGNDPSVIMALEELGYDVPLPEWARA